MLTRSVIMSYLFRIVNSEQLEWFRFTITYTSMAQFNENFIRFQDSLSLKTDSILYVGDPMQVQFTTSAEVRLWYAIWDRMETDLMLPPVRPGVM